MRKMASGDERQEDTLSTDEYQQIGDEPGSDHESDKPGRALTKADLQSAKYINEMMSHSVRNYATGWLLQDANMTLWYADRMGLVQSTPFDIFKEPHLLLLFVAALFHANHHKLGLCPLLSFPQRPKSDFRDYNGVELDLPTAHDCDRNELPPLRFRIVLDGKIKTDLGTIGRGTTVVPVQAIGIAEQHFGKERLIAKFAWPVLKRHQEDYFVRKVRNNLKAKKPAYLKHVVDLKCSMNRTMEDLQLPRALMSDLPSLRGFESRSLVCLVMEEYHSLETLKNIDELKVVFVDVVQGDYHLLLQ